MLKLGIVGSSGRMGSELKRLIESDGRFSYELGWANTKDDDKTVLSLSEWNPNLVDAVVDFSLPDSFESAYEWCSKNQKPLVTGTTGLEVETYSSKADFPFMHSGNYSLGVASLIKSISSFSKLGVGAQVWIEDYHHTKKLDAPSGTAVKINNKIESEFGRAAEIKSIRAGSIFGVHKVHIATDQEWVTISHQALNRGVFAEGALNAVHWLAGQKSGGYTFEEFLNSKSNKAEA